MHNVENAQSNARLSHIGPWGQNICKTDLSTLKIWTICHVFKFLFENILHFKEKIDKSDYIKIKNLCIEGHY